MPATLSHSGNGTQSSAPSNGSSGGSGDAQPSLASHMSHFALKIGGATPSAEILDALLEVTVENSLHLPDMCVLRFEAWDAQKLETARWANDSTFSPGKPIQMDAGYRDSLTPIFHGEVTAVEMDFSAMGVPTLIVRCLDKSHRLHRGRQSRSFVQVKDSDLVRQLAGEAGLNAKGVDATGDVHDWVFQNNQSNWDFLQERAGRNGFRLFVQGDGDLYFQKVKDPEGATVTLEWGATLRSFRPRLNGGHQVSQVTVKGWDRKTKQAIIGQKSSPNGAPSIGESKKAQQAGAGFSATGGAKMVVVDKPVFSQSEADGLAQSVFDDIAGEYVEADGLCYGDPQLKAGTTVEIKGAGSRFNGQYHVSSTTHSYTAAEGYTTQFAITGKRPGNLLSLLGDEGNASRAEMGGNIVIGIVTDNKDPDHSLGRVKVKYPWNTDDHASDWAPVASPMAGPGRGFFFLPEINDEVLVAFEHGDVRRPYVIGSLWNGKDKPVEKNSEAVAGGKVNRRTLKTRIGHTLLLDDTDDKGEMNLTTKYGHTLTLNDKDNKVEARTKDGHTITLDEKNNRIVVEDGKGQKITIDTAAQSIKMECNGNFDVDAKGKVTIKGALGMDLNTPVQMNIAGTTATNITGGIVKIN